MDALGSLSELILYVYEKLSSWRFALGNVVFWAIVLLVFMMANPRARRLVPRTVREWYDRVQRDADSDGNGAMWIAGTRTDKDWIALKTQLQTNPSQQLWESAFDDFYMARIRTRYLDPIDAIERTNAEEGEGFSVVALFCTLIEFLETCEKGHNFRIGADPNQTAQTFEYGLKQGRGYFENFLRTKKPFDTAFPSALVPSFYADVRCGLLHEARTQGTWMITTRTSDEHLVRPVGTSIHLYRQELKPAFNEYFADYRRRLLADVNGDLKPAFIRKFDHLATR